MLMETYWNSFIKNTYASITYPVLFFYSLFNGPERDGGA